ncbi:hypothetical protein QNH14_00070 [Apirhabdus apintestini]|nr:hypothetical protein QNH14_00070 [Enterobacteriaceae bacterium CA-0114]
MIFNATKNRGGAQGCKIMQRIVAVNWAATIPESRLNVMPYRSFLTPLIQASHVGQGKDYRTNVILKGIKIITIQRVWRYN